MESDMNMDWPNLARYRLENKKLDVQSNNQNRVVFMGDSITEGWSQLYPKYFGQRGYINRGISGQTTPQMLIRFKPDVIDLDPFVVVILAGTNDIAGNTGPSNIKMVTDNIFSMSHLAKAYGIKVVLSSILPVYEYEWAKEIKDVPSIILALNDKLKEFAISNNMEYLDYYSAVVNATGGLMEEYSPDGVHPNIKGYEVMSDLAEKILVRILD
tara:strand:- start:549 stop:1187 length:639 start_codon:yes stop_codon:yes gene_type:complete